MYCCGLSATHTINTTFLQFLLKFEVQSSQAIDFPVAENLMKRLYLWH